MKPKLCPECGSDLIVTSESVTCAGIAKHVLAKRAVYLAVDKIIAILESKGLGWSLDHTGNLIEARIWRWPSVIGRYRPHQVEPLALMLTKAMENAGFSMPLPSRADIDSETPTSDKGTVPQ